MWPIPDSCTWQELLELLKKLAAGLLVRSTEMEAALKGGPGQAPLDSRGKGRLDSLEVLKVTTTNHHPNCHHQPPNCHH